MGEILTAERAAELRPLVDKVIDLVRRRGGVTFVEIEQCLGEDIPLRGDHILALPEPYPNIVLWAGMSQVFVEVMAAVQQTHLLEIQPTSYLTYMIDGMLPSLPVAKARTDRQAKGYKTEHWAPVCFYAVRKEPKP